MITLNPMSRIDQQVALDGCRQFTPGVVESIKGNIREIGFPGLLTWTMASESYLEADQAEKFLRLAVLMGVLNEMVADN